jgi:hypothetical protein
MSLLLLSSTLQAQQCSTKTTTGKYLVLCDGYLTPGPNAPLVPAKLLGTATIDQDGQIKGATTAMIGGQMVLQVVTGKEKVNSDCTGTVIYAQKLNGQDGPLLDITFIVSDFGSRIDGLATDPGSVLSCVLRRTSFNLLREDR